jgi:thiosulfate/3-mercaptopyruvate sulfurtransferase
MKRRLLMAMVSIFALIGLLVVGAHAKHTRPPFRAIAPIVTTDWLEDNLGQEELVIIDIRSADEYAADHIPNSINIPFVVPFSAWITMRDDLLLEVPDVADLFNVIGSAGIRRDSLVVIVTTTANPPDPPYPLANATRVADTLIYAGVKNVAILDGGYPKWKAEGKPTDTEVPNVTPVTYRGRVNEAMFVPIEYVRKHIGKTVIIDARDADVYFGVTIEPFADKAGHIPSAKSLPTPWMWKSDGTYKDQEILSAMASGVIGRHKAKEIIIYCGVGGYASSWWFVLTQVLGYENVKLYDGAAQEWVRYYDMVPYQWD